MTKKVTKKKELKASKTTTNTSSHKVYFSFDKRVLVYSFLIIIFSFSSSFFIKRSFSFFNAKNITYKETSNLDYKVLLKKNDFYETNTLNKNMAYIASLIDKITINFNYYFNIDKESNLDFNYDIIGKLIISDGTKKNTYYEKEYTLLENVEESIKNQKIYQINKDIEIDYHEYNNLANKFRTSYGIDTTSRLIVYLNIHEKNSKNNKFNFNNNSQMSITIPLSEKAINITMDYNEVNKKSKLISNSEVVINNYLYIT